MNHQPPERGRSGEVLIPEALAGRRLMNLGMIGIGFILAGLPFFFEMVKPNRISGFRLRKTRSSPRIWYAANKVMGRDFLVSGIGLLAAAIILLALQHVAPGQIPIQKLETPIVLSTLFIICSHFLWRLAKM